MTDVLHRFIEAEIVARDGREIFGRIVPYGVATKVGADPAGLPFAITQPYTEMFEGGHMKRASRAPDRIALTLEHDLSGGLHTQLGFGTELSEKDDGAYAAFRVFKTPDGDKAIELFDAKILRSFSVGFIPLVPPRFLPNGTVVRTKTRIDEVAWCRVGAYPGAEVHGRRTDDDDPQPIVQEWSMRDRLKALGYVT